MAIVGGVVGGLAASAAGASVLVAVGVGIASAVAIDYAMDAMMEDIAVDTMGGRNVNTKETTKAREIVYGEIRKGGNILWQDVAGENNKYLYQITALAHDECEAIEKVYLDKELAWHNGTYQGKWFRSGGGGKKLDIVVKDGDRAQSEISTGSSSSDTYVDYWVNNGTYKHRLQRIAYVWTRFEFDREIYPNGVPTVTALIKGRKVYDPRIYSHDPDDGDTWAFSNNPVLCLLDYLRSETYGAGISMAQFDESQIQDAANYCNNMVGTPSRKRYMCNGVVNTSQSIRQNIKNLLSCMNGRITYAGGKLRIEPYQYATPHSTPLNEDIITGNFTVVAKTPRQDNYNVVKGTYVSKHIDYIKTEYPQQDTSTDTDNYEDNDGGTHVLNLDLPFTTDTISAQRLAKLVLLRSRMQQRIKARLSAKALDYRVGDNVSVTNAKFGITDNIYEITNCTVGFDSENGVYVDIEARENNSAIYDHTASTDIDYVAGEVIDLPTQFSTANVDLTTVQVSGTVQFDNGQYKRMLEVHWSAPQGIRISRYTVLVVKEDRLYGSWGHHTETPYIFVDPYEDYHFNRTEDDFYIWFLARSVAGDAGDWVKYHAQNVVFPDLPVVQDYWIYVDDAQVEPTSYQWSQTVGGLPSQGDRLTVIQTDASGNVVDAETYMWKPDLSFVAPYYGTSQKTAVFGDTHDAYRRMWVIAPMEVWDDITWSQTVAGVNSNDGSTTSSVQVMIFETTLPANGKALIVQLKIPESHYNSATYTGDYLYQSVNVTVTATYGNNQTNSITVPLSVYIT